MAARPAMPPPPKLSMYLVWNFFQTTPPPPDFSTFVEGWQYTASHVRKNKCFLVTQLHRNLDPKGKFPFVNHAAFDGPDFTAFTGPTPEFIAVSLKGHGPRDHQKKFPGGYGEHVTSTSKPLVPWLQKNKDSVWILTGIMMDQANTENAAEFEKNWMQQSGADFILNNSPKELGISKVGLYRKFTKLPGFDYVLRAELTNVGENLDGAWSFLEQLRAFKYPSSFNTTDSSLYKTDVEYTVFPDEGRKKLPEGHLWQDE